MYAPMVFCGSVRQTARVVAMAEIPNEAAAAANGGVVEGCSLSSAVAAAAVLLGGPGREWEDDLGVEEAQGCIARWVLGVG